MQFMSGTSWHVVQWSIRLFWGELASSLFSVSVMRRNGCSPAQALWTWKQRLFLNLTANETHMMYWRREHLCVCVFLCTELEWIIHNYFMLFFNCFPFLAIRCSWSEAVGKLQQLFAAWLHNNSHQTQH